MNIQSKELTITGTPPISIDLKLQLSNSPNGVITTEKPPYYKDNKKQVKKSIDKFLFIIGNNNSAFSFGVKGMNNFYRIKGEEWSGLSNPENYYIITTANDTNSLFKKIIPEIESYLFNGLYARIQSKAKEERIISWYNCNNNKWYKLNQTASGGADSKSTTQLYEIKREYGATSSKGNGFFYGAGIFENGKRDITSGRYVLINWGNSDVTGIIQAIGLGGDILQAITSIMQTNNSSSNNNKNYVLLKIVNNAAGYEQIYGSVDFIGDNYQHSLSEIRNFLNNSDNGVDLSTSSSSGSNWTGNSNFSSAEANPYTGLISNSIVQQEFIKDFPKYKLNFKCGKDNRSTITDLFEDNSENKIISTESETNDLDNLILKVRILPEQLLQVSNGMVLSDKYYLYVEINSNNISSEEEFFSEIDDKLNLDFNNNQNIWKDNKIPYDSNDNWRLLPQTACAIKKEDYSKLSSEEQDNLTLKMIKNKGYEQIGIKDFMINENRSLWKLLFFDIIKNSDSVETKISLNNSLSDFLNTISFVTKYVDKKTYSATFSFEQERKAINLYSLEVLEGYTRGHDFIQENYTSVRAKELDSFGKRIMKYDDNYFIYKYSGRNFDIMRKKEKNEIFTFSNGVYGALVHECDLLNETDVTLGESYGQKKYFIEYVKYQNKKGEYNYLDTFKVKNYLDVIDATKYTEEDLDVITSFIDLTQCEFYDPMAAKYENQWCDCKYGTENFEKECVYQKLGYCPYRFSTEKHPRRIRTLSQEKSNRFNIIQELSKVFEIYPQFYIEFDNNGRIILDEEGKMKKHVFFMTEKGNKNQLGFRYEKNLSNISRTVDSTSLTTKLFVENIDSDFSSTGLCSIQTAEDNISRTSYIMDFSYYTKMNILDSEQIIRDLYGVEKGDFAFLPTIGYYNKQYDQLTNLIVNLTGETMVKLQAENDTYIQGVTTALEEKQKICQKMYQFKIKSLEKGNEEYITSDSYKNYLTKMKEQSTILWGLVETLFFSGNYCNLIFKNTQGNFSFESCDITNLKSENLYTDFIIKYKNDFCNGELFWRIMIEGFDDEEYEPLFTSWIDFKENILDKYLYITNGTFGQYSDMYNQVKYWKTERAKWLNKINDISESFYKKYEPFIKEGTWTDNNYLTDNEYYWAAVNVLNDSSQPKITYNLDVIDLYLLDEDYKFELADTSYIEDIDFFGINKKTGLPNKQKVLISSLTFDLDNPTNDSIEVKNYTSSFDELFQSISASVQSLTFNENTYKRASNFTATKYISKESLQGTLFDGDLTLVQDYSENIKIDDKGVAGKNIGNPALGYKLDGEGLAFTKDNGQTYDIGVGPNGINADYIKFGQLDASKIQIIDGNYIYFLWDKDGLNAYRSPATSTNGLVDFARFNKYGLSLIENNNVRLRAGYEFKNDPIKNTSGNYNTEMELETQNIGFYLYNDSGQAIFKTETASDYADVDGDYSARLSLTGEMFITNKILEGENDGSIISKSAEISLQGSWLINRQNLITLYPQNTWLNLLNQLYKIWNAEFGFKENGEAKNICSESGTIDNEKLTVKISKTLDSNSQISLPIYVFRDIPQILSDELNYSYDPINKIVTRERANLFKKLNYSYIKYILNFSEDEYSIFTTEEDFITIQISINTIQNKIISTTNGNYSILTTWIKYSNDEKNIEQTYTSSLQSVLVSTYNNPTETTTTVGDITKEIKTFFDLSELNEGDSIGEITRQLYSYSYGTSGGTVNYWNSKTETGNYITQSTSPIKTDEVGIFINNKLGLKESSSYDQFSEDIYDEESNSINLFSNRSSSINITDSSFLIIGDSITEGLASTELKDNAFGIGSANFGDFNKFSELQNLKGKTTVAYFMGMNEDYRINDTDQSYQERYKTFINKTLEYLNNGENNIQNIYLISITALDENLGGSNKTTENIEKSNIAIKEMAANDTDINGFIDVYDASKNFEHSDKVHFTINGLNDLWCSFRSRGCCCGRNSIRWVRKNFYHCIKRSK